MSKCFAFLEDDVLKIGNEIVYREFNWNGGNPAGLTCGRENWSLQSSGDLADFKLAGEEEQACDGQLQSRWCESDAISPEHLEATVTYRLGTLHIKRVFRVYPGCSAIACDLYLKGTAKAESWIGKSVDQGMLSNIENKKAEKQGVRCLPILDRISFQKMHVKFTNVSFFDITDRRNNLVQETSGLAYRNDLELQGQLLLLEDVLSGNQVFMLKESPCHDVELSSAGCSFKLSRTHAEMIGIGVEPRELSEQEWTRCYGSVFGVAASGTFALRNALRQYQNQLRVSKSGRDHMVMLNTWGDRGQDAKLGEAFALREIEAASRLGISHFQLDDGWQKGRSKNSAFEGGTNDHIWKRNDFWNVHPQRFPNGLAPVKEAADKAGIELCLWYNPYMLTEYKYWEKDANCLIELYQQHGIRTFKIDGVQIPDKITEVRMRAMFDKVLAATDNDAVFNLDLTAGKRFGYHYFAEYGNKFVENRYTDWENYYPHWTLRNLWQLSEYVPPSALQMEFLNKWRNADRYPENDPLKPFCVPFDYCFAATMFAQPLAWFEAASLPEEAFEIAGLIKTYRKHQEEIHSGTILPIGEMPDGTSWTGMQSLKNTTGYVCVYREFTSETSAKINLWNLKNSKIIFTCIAGKGTDFTAEVGSQGAVKFSLPEPFSFALYKYEKL